jgi:hypothetical protein
LERRKIRKVLAEHLVTTYSVGSVALERGAVDLHIGPIVGKNSPALEVACPPPGHGRKIKKILETITPPLT